MISGTLRIPVCLAESFITRPLYLDCTPYLCSMPWLSDYPGHGSVDQVLLEKTFTHMLRIRTIQSKVMCTAPTLGQDEVEPFIVKMEDEINKWSDHSQIFMHMWVLSPNICHLFFGSACSNNNPEIQRT